MTNKINITIDLTDDILNQIADRVAQKTASPNHKVASVQEVFSPDDVAKLLNKTPATITRHIRLGLLVASKTGKSYTITLENLNNYINGQ